MINRGLYTTLASDIALILSAVIAGQAISTELWIQVAIPVGAIVLAYLDIKYPETMDKLERALGIAEEAQAKVQEVIDMAKYQEAPVAEAKTVADEPVVGEEGV